MNANKPSSPCIQVCQMDAKSALCRGCGRTMEEISNWWRFPEAERLRLMAALPARIAAKQTKR